MSREVRFTATDEEYADILRYVQAKRRWRKVSHFLRDACFQTMDRYPSMESKRAKRALGGTAHASGDNLEGTP